MAASFPSGRRGMNTAPPPRYLLRGTLWFAAALVIPPCAYFLGSFQSALLWTLADLIPLTVAVRCFDRARCAKNTESRRLSLPASIGIAVPLVTFPFLVLIMVIPRGARGFPTSSAEASSRLEKGMSRDQVRSRLGSPAEIQAPNDRNELWIYEFEQDQGVLTIFFDLPQDSLRDCWKGDLRVRREYKAEKKAETGEEPKGKP